MQRNEVRLSKAKAGLRRQPPTNNSNTSLRSRIPEMPSMISALAQVDPRARIGNDVQVGPFCVIGPHVSLGDGCRLDNHVTLVGHLKIGQRNRFWPGTVIGAEPQDYSYLDAATRVEIGDDNLFREGVTVNRG